MDSMLSKLMPLGLYSLERTTAAYKELKVYSTFLDEVEGEIDNLFNELMVTTATDYGIFMWEQLWGVARDDLTPEQRRRAISDRLSLTCDKCDIAAVTKFFESMGAAEEFTEVPERNRLYIYITNGAELSTEMRRYITAQAIEFLPAHLDIFIDYRTGNWDTLDSKQNTFDTYDSFGYTCDQLEQYE